MKRSPGRGIAGVFGSLQATIEFMNGVGSDSRFRGVPWLFPRAIRLDASAARGGHITQLGVIAAAIAVWQFITQQPALPVATESPLSHHSLIVAPVAADGRSDENRCLPVPDAVDTDRKRADFRLPYCFGRRATSACQFGDSLWRVSERKAITSI